MFPFHFYVNERIRYLEAFTIKLVFKAGITKKQGQKVKVKIKIKVTFCDLQYWRIHNVSICINFHQNQFINECVRKNFLKFPERQMIFCDLQ